MNFFLKKSKASLVEHRQEIKEGKKNRNNYIIIKNFTKYCLKYRNTKIIYFKYRFIFQSKRL